MELKGGRLTSKGDIEPPMCRPKYLVEPLTWLDRAPGEVWQLAQNTAALARKYWRAVSWPRWSCACQFLRGAQPIFKIRPLGEGQWLICLTVDEIVVEVKQGDREDEWEIEIAWMTDAEYANLEEHGGW